MRGSNVSATALAVICAGCNVVGFVDSRMDVRCLDMGGVRLELVVLGSHALGHDEEDGVLVGFSRRLVVRQRGCFLIGDRHDGEEAHIVAGALALSRLVRDRRLSTVLVDQVDCLAHIRGNDLVGALHPQSFPSRDSVFLHESSFLLPKSS